LYSIIPSILLIVINSFFIYRALLKKTTINTISNQIAPNKIESKKKLLSVAISIITIGFLLCTIPLAISTVLYRKLQESRSNGRLIILICDAISFTYHSIKFEILLVYNNMFKMEFLKSCRVLYEKSLKIKRNSIKTTTTTTFNDESTINSNQTI
jgi:hypothetical protein